MGVTGEDVEGRDGAIVACGNGPGNLPPSTGGGTAEGGIELNPLVEGGGLGSRVPAATDGLLRLELAPKLSP